jgi:hypothetical protein
VSCWRTRRAADAVLSAYRLAGLPRRRMDVAVAVEVRDFEAGDESGP